MQVQMVAAVLLLCSSIFVRMVEFTVDRILEVFYGGFHESICSINITINTKQTFSCPQWSQMCPYLVFTVNLSD